MWTPVQAREEQENRAMGTEDEVGTQFSSTITTGQDPVADSASVGGGQREEKRTVHEDVTESNCVVRGCIQYVCIIMHTYSTIIECMNAQYNKLSFVHLRTHVLYRRMGYQHEHIYT